MLLFAICVVVFSHSFARGSLLSLAVMVDRFQATHTCQENGKPFGYYTQPVISLTAVNAASLKCRCLNLTRQLEEVLLDICSLQQRSLSIVCGSDSRCCSIQLYHSGALASAIAIIQCREVCSDRDDRAVFLRVAN